MSVAESRTVLVDGEAITGTVYHIRGNGWFCVKTDSGRVASGPEVIPCFNCSGVGRVPIRSDGSMGDMNCRVCTR